jgi:hypothetical protein
MASDPPGRSARLGEALAIVIKRGDTIPARGRATNDAGKLVKDNSLLYFPLYRISADSPIAVSGINSG